jgi:hypothetical protein
LPQGHTLTSIATGGATIVAVGAGGTILVTLDGVHWETRAATTEYVLNDVAYGNGRFVAVGGATGFEGSPGLGVYLSSADGWHWDETHRTEYFTPVAVTWNGSQFVAAGRAGRVLMSPDGETWSDHDLAVTEWDMVDLLWDGARYLAVGYENYFTGDLSLFTSTNGTSWEIQPLESECHPSALTFLDDLYVAVGGLWPGRPCVLTSEDGENWGWTSWEVLGLFRDVTQGNGGLLAVGVSGLVASSPDGYAWGFHEKPSGEDLLGLSWTGERFVTVGEYGLLLSSPDGLAWDALSSDSLELSDLVEIEDVAMGGGGFVAVGGYGVVVTSTDGTVWNRRPTAAPSGLHAVTATDFGYWAVGRYTVLWSATGENWNLVWYDENVNLFDVSWNGAIFVAVGWNPSSSSRRSLVLTSTDGLAWSSQWLETEGPLLAVEWAGSRFVTVGALGLQFESADGITWHQRPLDESVELRDLAWNGDRLVAIGGISGVGSVVMSSSGDVEWDVATPSDGVGFDFDDLVWTGNRFVAVGKGNGNFVAWSVDGISWFSESSGTGLRLIAAGGDERVTFAFGRGGSIVKRKEPHPYTFPPRRSAGRMSPVTEKAATAGAHQAQIPR